MLLITSRATLYGVRSNTYVARVQGYRQFSEFYPYIIFEQCCDACSRNRQQIQCSVSGSTYSWETRIPKEIRTPQTYFPLNFCQILSNNLKAVFDAQIYQDVKNRNQRSLPLKAPPQRPQRPQRPPLPKLPPLRRRMKIGAKRPRGPFIRPKM